MYDFSMEDLATFTGRSLATFKRDFKKISTLTPQKWLIHKRLEAAYEKMKTGTRKVQDVYLEVGIHPTLLRLLKSNSASLPPLSPNKFP